MPQRSPLSRRAPLGLRERLAHLSLLPATRLLGTGGAQLLRAGGRLEARAADARFEGDVLHLPVEGVDVRVELREERRGGLAVVCAACTEPCVHGAALLALVLEEKTALGLARPPAERVPLEALGEDELVERALAEREARSRAERMRIRPHDARRAWTDYTVTSQLSGKSYRLALRGLERGESFCSCPDFRTNTLGTCKHLMAVLRRVRKRFSASTLRRPPRRRHVSVSLRYGPQLELVVRPPDEPSPEVARVLAPLLERPVTEFDDLLRRVRALQELDQEVVVHPDAEQYLEQSLRLARLSRVCAAIRADPAGHPLRQELLRAPLLPYQLDGIAFAAAAGRAVLADEMGLGKTVQAIGLAELLAREAGIERVLVVCPASVKAQWRGEIERFSTRGTQLVVGSAAERAEQWSAGRFFTVCNYEQVLRDLDAVARVPWDLVVLDEGQRIKNWEAKTTRTIKELRSPFALVLSGTPLENRLEELYSVVEFVDARLLGPAFRFFHRHRSVDDRGRVEGYVRLDELRARLAPVLLRRTRGEVMAELPARSTEIVRIAPTEEQLALHATHMRVVRSIIDKPYISEMDLLRLQKALLMCRLAANATVLVDREEPGRSSKLERLEGLLGDLLAEPERKIVLFSEWTRMLDRIEPLLDGHGARFVRLDGRVPQQKRQALVRAFREDPLCRLFLATNAGATGLNLQVADTLVNVDLPWNPAVLEQRIGRIHRMGQARRVQVWLLVTELTIEERLLDTLAAKHELAQAVLDPDSRVDTVDLFAGGENLKRRLEVLMGRRPEDAPARAEPPAAATNGSPPSAPAPALAEAGGRLLEAAIGFLAELAPPGAAPDPLLARALHERLAAHVEPDASGRPSLRLTLPDSGALERLASSLAGLLTR